MTGPVLAAQEWKTNGAMIADVARLGYIRKTSLTLDPTYGAGVWWTEFRPDRLIARSDRTEPGFDFRRTDYRGGTFDVVAYDPPYKLNGAGSKPDARYGVEEWASWQDRHDLCRAGATECARVLKPGGYLLWKCQDQVCGGKVRWQGREFAAHAERIGLEMVDEFYYLSRPRPQPDRSRLVCSRCKRTVREGKPCRCPKGTPTEVRAGEQQHAYGRPSRLMIFRQTQAPFRRTEDVETTGGMF